ncbi:MAG: DUF2336 domain-containing protein [Pseudolabrys sp.]
MSMPASLLPELEEVVQRGSPGKRAEMLTRITDLFLGGADNFGPEHVGLFDDVIGYLIDEIETQALAELSRRIAPVPNAPDGVVRTLATSDDITVAGPVLRRTPIADDDLEQIAQTRGQAHLLAISERPGLTEELTDILVRRGDGAVARSIATNRQARISDQGFTALVQRAKLDGVLAEKVGGRSDIPPRLFRQLVLQATDVVQKRLLANARPETQTEIRRVLSEVSDAVGAKATPRNYEAALALVRGLQKDGKLNEAAITGFASNQKYEETIAGLATLSAVPVETVDRLLAGDRSDPVIILARAANFGWETVRTIIESRAGAKGTSTQVIDAAKQNYDMLSPATAERVVRFWQVRPNV